MKTALIAGATGLTGKKLLFSLLNNKEYIRIFVLVRKELAIKDAKLSQIIFNYDNESDYHDLPIVNEVFCCLGTTIKKAGSEEAFKKVDMDYPLILADYYSKKGCEKYLIITALGANESSGIFYNKIKGITEEKLKKINFNSIYICRPSLLLGDRDEFRLGELLGKFFAKLVSWFLVGSLKKYRAIEASVLADAMMKLAAKNEKGIFVVESDQLQALSKRNGQ